MLANNFMRRDGRDWLTDESREGKDIKERIEKANGELCDVADRVIVQELKESLNLEINSKKELRDNKMEEINKQKEIYAKKKKDYEDNLEKYNTRLDNYNAKIEQTDNDIKNYNNNLAAYNKDNTKVDKAKLDNDREEIEKTQEELKKQREEIEKGKEEIRNEREKVNKENDITNELIDEYNKYNQEANERIELYNNLKEHLTIDFSKDEIKITIKKNDIDMPNFYSAIKQIEKDSNLAYKDELKKIAKFEEEKDNIIKILEKRNEFEQLLLKVIKENNNYWNNCFNKAFYALKYVYNSDDMKRINQYNINKNNKKDDFYYIKDISNEKYINKAKEKLLKNKIIFGNNYNERNMWDNFYIIPFNGSSIFLYKSPDGKNPSGKLVDVIQEITGGGYTTKINSTVQKKEKLLTEVDAIENNKIIMKEIESNKNDFINGFEKYSKFYNEDKEIKEKVKQKLYPEEFIKGLYDEIKKRNNTLRISIVFFRYYFLNEEKDYEIDIEFLNQIYNILLNYDIIDDKEKEILKKEYTEIINVYNNVYAEIKKKEEEEQKEVEEIVQKKKHRHDIKNKKNK